MSKNFLIRFGSGNPTAKTGLTPTFSVFKTIPGGVNATPPGITEIPTSTGLYYFTYGPTTSVSFVIDGGSSLSSPERYVVNLLDPIEAVDEQLSALGATILAGQAALGSSILIGQTSIGASILSLLGTTASSFGSTATDPGTVMGFLKRQQEFNEGNSIFDKTASTWGIFARGNAVGTSTMLTLKTLADASGSVTKS